MIKIRFQQGMAGIGIILSSFLLAASSTIVLAPWIYQGLISILKLESISGLTADQLQANFKSLMGYLTNPAIHSLELPDFQSSPGALQHFEEVKVIFLLVFIFGFLAFIGSAFICRWLRKKRFRLVMDPWLRLGQIMPLLVLFVALIAFDRLFLFLHQVLFNNDLWLFDPVTDPVITVLPEELFLVYLIAIILIYEIILFVYRMVILRK